MSLAASAHRQLGFQPRRRGRYWHQIAAGDLVALVDVALLAAVTAILTFASRRLGFARADEITVVFCGSKKSLASGGARWPRCYAIGAVPPDPTHGLRVARTALRSARGHREWTASKSRRNVRLDVRYHSYNPSST
jgi:hypothetical protein